MTKNITTITSIARRTVSTVPTAMPPDADKVFYDFFKDPANRHVLLTDDGKYEMIDNPSTELAQAFKEQSNALMGQSILSTATTEHIDTFAKAKGPIVKVLGTRISPILTYGARLYLPAQVNDSLQQENATQTLPEFQFVLLDTELDVSSGPIAWIFRLLNKSRKKFMKVSSISKVTIGIKQDDPNQPKCFVFSSNAMLSSSSDVPSWVLKAMLSTKEKLEEKGSMAMQESLDKNITPRMERFLGAYETYIRTKSQK